MTIVLWLLANWRTALLIGAGVILAAVVAHDRLTAHALDQEKARGAVLEQQLAGAVETNKETIAEVERLKAANAKAQAVEAEAARRDTARAASIATIRSEVAHVQVAPGQSLAIGPYSLDALRRLRGLKAAAGHNQDPGGKAADPPGPAGMPARP